jgi:hypothetical protein
MNPKLYTVESVYELNTTSSLQCTLAVLSSEPDFLELITGIINQESTCALLNQLADCIRSKAFELACSYMDGQEEYDKQLQKLMGKKL